MAVRGLNYLDSSSDSVLSSSPEQNITTIEVIPTTEQAKSFGEHILRYKHNVETMESITKSRDKKFNAAFDKLDRTTQKLMEYNAKHADSAYQPSSASGRHHLIK